MFTRVNWKHTVIFHTFFTVRKRMEPDAIAGLRSIVGESVSQTDLEALLRGAGMDVETAANHYFDGATLMGAEPAAAAAAVLPAAPAPATAPAAAPSKAAAVTPFSLAASHATPLSVASNTPPASGFRSAADVLRDEGRQQLISPMTTISTSAGSSPLPTAPPAPSIAPSSALSTPSAPWSTLPAAATSAAAPSSTSSTSIAVPAAAEPHAKCGTIHVGTAGFADVTASWAGAFFPPGAKGKPTSTALDFLQEYFDVCEVRCARRFATE